MSEKNIYSHPHAGDGAVTDVGEPLDDQPGAGHLRQPVVVAALAPVVGVVLVGDGEHADLVSLPVQLLHRGVVGVSVRHEEGALDGAAVGVDGLAVEDLLVEVDVVGVDGAVEGDGDHLGDLVRVDVAGDPGAVRRAEAVGQLARGSVALGGAVGVLTHTYCTYQC